MGLQINADGDDVRDLQALLHGFKAQLSRLDKEVSEKVSCPQISYQLLAIQDSNTDRTEEGLKTSRILP